MPGGPMGGPRRQVVAPPVKDFKKTTKKLIKNYLAKYKIALIIVMIINIFLKSSIITLAFSFIGVIIFAALIAWDSQRFRQMYIQYGNQINTTNLAIMGALQLYLDFVNLFIQLLNIFTGLGGNKD